MYFYGKLNMTIAGKTAGYGWKPKVPEDVDRCNLFVGNMLKGFF